MSDGQVTSATSGKAVGFVLTIEGGVRAQSIDGQERPLKVGDPIFNGDTIVTNGSGAVIIEFLDGNNIEIGNEKIVEITDEVVTDKENQELVAEAAAEAEALQQAILAGLDPTQIQEAPAVGDTTEAQGAIAIANIDRDNETSQPTFGFTPPKLDTENIRTDRTIAANADKSADEGGDLAVNAGGANVGFINAIEASGISSTLSGVDSDVVSITVTYSDGSNQIVVSATQTGTTWSTGSIDISSLTDGTISIGAVVTDGEGNTAEVTGNVTLDTSADADNDFSINVQASDDVTDASEATNVNVNLSGVDADAASVVVTFTDTDSPANTVTSVASLVNGEWVLGDTDISGLTNGVITVSAVVTDDAGNTTTSTDTLTLDAVLVDDETVLTLTAVEGGVTEDSTVAGNTVATFTLSDEDEDEAVDFTAGSNDNGYYAISGTNIVLTEAGETFLDAGNALPQISLSTSGTSTDKTATATPETSLVDDGLTVEVNNVMGTITEGSASTETAVGTASSDNPDSSTLTYTISDETNYVIDEDTGAITLSATGAALVNAGGDLPNFTVSASTTTGDSGTSDPVNPGNTSDVDDGLTVEVNNVMGTITEGSASTETAVGTASSDNPDSSTLTYTISDETNYVIDEDTGAITLSATGAALVNAGGDLPNFTVSASTTTGDSGTSDPVNPGNTSDVDDAPIIGAVSDTSVSEEGLSGANAESGDSVVTSVTTNFTVTDEDNDADDLSVTLTAPTTSLTSDGVAIVWSGSGTATLIGSAGGVEVIRVAATDPDEDNEASYTTTLSGPVDHSDTSTEDSLSFDLDIVVSDGTSNTSETVNISIADDSPDVSNSTASLAVVATDVITVKNLEAGFSSPVTDDVSYSVTEIENDDDSLVDGISWGGTGNDNAGASSLEMTDIATSTVVSGTSFSLLDFEHVNTAVSSSTSLESATLDITFDLDVGGVTSPVTIALAVTHNATSNNNDDAQDNADWVTIVTQEIEVDVDGNTYTVVVEGFTDLLGNTVSSFSTLESATGNYALTAHIDAPTAAEQSVSGTVNTDAGADGFDHVTWGDVSSSYGTMTANNDGTYTFVLADDADITDTVVETFTYQVFDNDGDSVTSTLSLTLEPEDTTADEGDDFAVNITDGFAITNDAESTVVAVTLTGVDSDAESVVVTFTDSSNTSVTTTASESGGVWSVANTNLSSLTDGDISVSALVTDDAGNTSTATNTLVLDTSADTDSNFSVNLASSDETVGASEAGNVSVTLSGVDDDAVSVLVTFMDVSGASVVATATNDPADGWLVADTDISGLDDGAVTVSAVVTDDAGNTSTANDSLTLDTSDTVMGLNAQYYAFDGSLTDIDSAMSVVDSNDPDASFVATEIQYSVGNNELGDSDNFESFIGTDAASLDVSPNTDTSEAILYMTGDVSLDASTYNFQIRADDGYQIKIDGVVVASVDRNQEPTTTTHANFTIGSSGIHSIEIVYWDQGGDYVFEVDLSDDNGATYSALGGSDYQTSFASNYVGSVQGLEEQVSAFETTKFNYDSHDQGTGQDDETVGTSGDDYLRGKQGNDDIDGAEREDLIVGGWGEDTLSGGTGNDLIFGDYNNIISDNDDQDDTLKGDAGDDILIGGGGDDTLLGGADDDTLFGGTGSDTLTGGTGSDMFILDDTSDTITDFDAGEDSLDITELLSGLDGEPGEGATTDAIAEFLSNNVTVTDGHVMVNNTDVATFSDESTGGTSTFDSDSVSIIYNDQEYSINIDG